jgi:hypothetical protein
MKRLMLIAAAVAMLGASSRKDSYIISIGHQTTISGTNVEQLVSITKRFSGRYVWVRRGGREYLITDDTTLSRAQALFAEQLALAPEQEAVGREESRLDREADRLEDKDERLTAAEHQRLDEQHDQLRDVARRERELDRKEEALEREAERGLWELVDDAIHDGIAKPLTR